MASLYYTYSAMNAGKSTSLLQVAHNYEERDQRVLLLTPAIDERAGKGKIASRLGIDRQALAFTSSTDLAALIEARNGQDPVDCVLIDEAQFLTETQVWQLTDVVDRIDIPVMCYGIRTDAFGQAFPGSAVLLAVADKVSEMKTICSCGRKATMNLRIDENGDAVKVGEQIAIGGNDRYISCCRKHWKEKLGLR
ncbi:thymidine kinase [Pseudidiomarina terrestris]|uniref:Thymidine kinase n=1 Tax=Pseudidiomarina terrestris TaxID=2820060 RepID=A0AAW7QZF5_9GAMM|nr:MULTISPECIES: thymidine kinase [unclassified Pseudidiomarina]MDN7124260.1 thymidine kinase [Pseudidiomarina sp. 1APP75-32.1]MDN7126261.1 thymidine kinase [Pseudidiomarina sp. 1APR75-33.1]MDN7129449.1 thymidine kinase [Pseudidiomarina sp. 1APR75-15]MDN7134286.1 thymidine kinase [Pseudidiomarina sp. 1ASP75-5]MDN7137026.1 thymidine kinase [Pseudidiomarina sp. 1ASP75-14]